MANLANRLRFAKLKPSKLVVTIDNPLADLLIRQTFFRQTLDSPNILPAKLSRYTVLEIIRVQEYCPKGPQKQQTKLETKN